MTCSKLKNPKFVKELDKDCLKIALALKINRIDHCPKKIYEEASDLSHMSDLKSYLLILVL